MATFPADPNLPAATTSTEIDPDFLNTLIDNINALGSCLGDLVNNTADGNIDLAIDKGIEWGDVLKIYFSAGDIIIDDDVDISGTLKVDTINDSGASTITVNESMTFAAGKDIDVPTIKVDAIDDSGADIIEILEDIRLASTKYLYANFLDHATGQTEITSYSSLTLRDATSILKVRNSSEDRPITIVSSSSGEVYQDFCTTTAGGDPVSDPVSSTARIWYYNGELKCKINQSGSTVTRKLAVHSPSAYTVANRVTDRAYDCNTVAIEELADVVGTLIYDLQQLGLVG